MPLRGQVCYRGALRPLPGTLAPLDFGARRFAGILRRGPVAQWLEPAAHNRLVAGSSPAGPTNMQNFVARLVFIPIYFVQGACIPGLLGRRVL